MIGSSREVAALQSLSWQLSWQIVDNSGKVDYELGLSKTRTIRELVRSGYDGVTSDVNGQGDAKRAQGLKGPKKAGEMELEGESSSARPSGKISFDHLAYSRQIVP